MSSTIVGRRQEIKELEEALTTDRPELIALYGRRRVGKTFLVRQTYGERIVFEVAGLLNGNKKEQLQNFAFTLRDAFPDHLFSSPFPDWLTAFHELGRALDQYTPPGKSVLFFDELPWLASPKSGFLMAFGNFWNTYAEKRPLVVVICGSAASWMIKRVVQHRGGLHNRITRLLALAPFTLGETHAFCRSRGLSFSSYQLLQIYMTLGGVPAYLEQLRPGQSAVQNIQRVCFSRNGFLRNEFSRLFASLFKDYERHVKIVQHLAARRAGLTREELRRSLKADSGGSLTRILEELFESGFIGIYAAFDKKRKAQLYRLTDPYTLFHLTFIERLPKGDTTNFTELSQLPGWAAWSGYAFENVWLSHLNTVRSALGITGVSSRFGTFTARGTADAPGVQIDLLIDRRDHVISICEAKFSSEVLTVTKKLMQELGRKKTALRAHTGTKKQLSVVLLTTYGIAQLIPELDHIDEVLTIEKLMVASK